MAETAGSPSAAGGTEQIFHRIADERLEVSWQERTVYIDGRPNETITGRPLELLDMVAARAGSILPTSEICEELWGGYNESSKVGLTKALSMLQEGLGPELGDPESGAVRRWPRYGLWAAKTLAHNGVIPPVEDDSPVRALADARLKVYPDQCVVVKDGEVIEDLTPGEYGLLAELARRPGRTAGAGVLREAAALRGSGMRGLEDQMKNLRKKLGQEDLGHPRRGIILKKPGGYAGQRTLN